MRVSKTELLAAAKCPVCKELLGVTENGFLACQKDLLHGRLKPAKKEQQRLQRRVLRCVSSLASLPRAERFKLPKTYQVRYRVEGRKGHFRRVPAAYGREAGFEVVVERPGHISVFWVAEDEA